MNDNTEKDYKQRIHNTANSFSNGYLLDKDYILAVEGLTDKKFYQKFTNLEILIAPEINKEKIVCRKKILDAISNQKKNGKHWFGIMDADYSLPIIPSEIEIGKEIIFTDANSLETMLVKYAGIDNFERIIKKINWQLQLVKRYYLDRSFVLLALEFSYKVGCLRKKSDEDSLYLNFEGVLKSSNYYLDFLTFTKQTEIIKNNEIKIIYTVSFDFDKFVDSLIEKTHFFVDDEVSLKSIGDKIFSLKTSSWIEYCQGHDIIHFILALNKIHQKISNYTIKQLSAPTHDILDNQIITKYKKEFFDQSKIVLWLQDKQRDFIQNN